MSKNKNRRAAAIDESTPPGDIETPETPTPELVFDTGRNGPYGFVQFVAVIAVQDQRGQEELTDRAVIGRPLGPHGQDVKTITLTDGWFAIVTERGEYLVPVSNVRSARR